MGCCWGFGFDVVMSIQAVERDYGDRERMALLCLMEEGGACRRLVRAGRHHYRGVEAIPCSPGSLWIIWVGRVDGSIGKNALIRWTAGILMAGKALDRVVQVHLVNELGGVSGVVLVKMVMVGVGATRWGGYVGECVELRGALVVDSDGGWNGLPLPAFCLRGIVLE